MSEIQIIRKYYGLSWPTLFVGSITLILICYGIYKIYITAITTG